jgi:hypothetical protein
MSVRNKKVMPLSKARGNGPEKDKTLENPIGRIKPIRSFLVVKNKKGF